MRQKDRIFLDSRRGSLSQVAFGFDPGQFGAFEQAVQDVQRVLAQHYYHPDFAGSYSLKQVVPALCPELRYDQLEIQDGKTASVMVERALGMGDAVEKERIYEALKLYCQMDTKAMVQIRRNLAAVECDG